MAAQRRAALLYASAMQAEEFPTATAWEKRADACKRLGDYLTESGIYYEAATYFQEATDCYARVETEEAEIATRACARKLLEVVALLRSRPDDRLYLLTSHYERQKQQFALHPGMEARQAECSVHIARIFQRRDRPHEAITHYEEALRLYGQSAPTDAILLACAEVHHRIAGLYANALEAPNEAAHHYREAIALYTACESVVHGEQTARALCVHALAMLEE